MKFIECCNTSKALHCPGRQLVDTHMFSSVTNDTKNIDAPEFLKTPIMSGSILQVLNLDSHNGLGEWTVFIPILRGHQVRGEWGVESVSEQHKLELDLRIRGKQESVTEDHARSKWIDYQPFCGAQR